VAWFGSLRLDSSRLAEGEMNGVTRQDFRSGRNRVGKEDGRQDRRAKVSLF
jgi:hypothetical protein